MRSRTQKLGCESRSEPAVLILKERKRAPTELEGSPPAIAATGEYEGIRHASVTETAWHHTRSIVILAKTGSNVTRHGPRDTLEEAQIAKNAKSHQKSGLPDL
jgi:hypothetical protein